MSQADGFTERKGSFQCTICLTRYQSSYSLSFSTAVCQHLVCFDCTQTYFRKALEDSKYISFEKIPCSYPRCLGSYKCIDIIDLIFDENEAAHWWSTALRLTCFKNKIACPFEGCEAIYDTEDENMKKCTFGVCFECSRGFCIPCQGLWHPDKIKHKKKEDETEKILAYALKAGWCRCPRCHHLVEKVEGCTNISCRCGTTFCYRCGGYTNSHNCLNRCQDMSSERLNQVRSPMFASMRVSSAIK